MIEIHSSIGTRLFPNSREEAKPAAAAPKGGANDPIARAERLHKAGRTPTAVNQAVYRVRHLLQQALGAAPEPCP